MNKATFLALFALICPILVLFWLKHISVPYWFFQFSMFLSCMAYGGVSWRIVPRLSDYRYYLFSKALAVGYYLLAINALTKLG